MSYRLLLLVLAFVLAAPLASAAPDAGALAETLQGTIMNGDPLPQDQARSVTRTQVLLQTLSVTRSGSGTGTVTSEPAGIDCGGTCSADFDDGTLVTLTATAGSN